MTSLSSIANKLHIDISRQRLRLVPSSLSGVPEDDSGDRADSQADNAVSERSFEVEVINESDRFSSFQIELSVPGQDIASANRWYEVEPEVCAKVPPGDRSRFQVVINRAPIPAINTTLDLAVHIFSVEYEDLEAVRHLDLTIGQRKDYLQVVLVSPHLKALPGEKVPISVLALNFQSQPADIKVKLLRLNHTWFLPAPDALNPTPCIERVLPGGDNQRLTFHCVPTQDPLTDSGIYGFDVEISDRQGNYSSTAHGTLEILPMGVVTFACSPKQQVIPGPMQQWIKQGIHQTAFALEFHNQSNIQQHIQIEAAETRNHHCRIKPLPPLELAPGEATDPVPLTVRRQRPLLGWDRRLLIEVTPELSESHSGESLDPIPLKPSSQMLDVRVRPVIPLWVQLLAGLLAVGFLGWLWWIRPVARHKAPVTAVHILSNRSDIISGARDQTLRRWAVMPFVTWFTGQRRLWPEGIIASPTVLGPDISPDNSLNGFLSTDGDPAAGQPILTRSVRTIEESPDQKQVAIGLEDGSIQLWDITPADYVKTLSADKDRVFSLNFSRDGQYLFSGHGSGIVRQWDVQSVQSNSRRTKQELILKDVSIQSLARLDLKGDELLAIAGQGNHLVIWDWRSKDAYTVPYGWHPTEALNIVPVSSRHNALTDVVSSADGQFLVTSDNKGFITVWDTKEIAGCFSLSRITAENDPDMVLDKSGNRHIPLVCDAADLQITQWQVTPGGQAVRAIALTKNGRHLVSAADTGQLQLWSLTDNHQRADINPKLIDDFSNHIPQTIDIQEDDGDRILIAVDAPGNQVRLYRRRVKI